MTKKDYVLIAKLIREGRELQETQKRSLDYSVALYRFASNFAMEAQLQNPSFDPKRFIEACGFLVLPQTH